MLLSLSSSSVLSLCHNTENGWVIIHTLRPFTYLMNLIIRHLWIVASWCLVWGAINHPFPNFNCCLTKSSLKLGQGWVFIYHSFMRMLLLSLVWLITASKMDISMMTSSNGNIFRVTGHLCGEFTAPRWIPRTKSSDAELWCFLWSRLNKRLSKQSWGWWFETLSRPLWRHSNGLAESRNILSFGTPVL